MRSLYTITLLAMLLATLTNLDFSRGGEDKRVDVVAAIDYRNRTEASGSNYFVVFCARQHNLREGSVGHAWVMWGVEDAKKMESRIEKAFGFWPKEGKGKFSIVNVPGELADELLDPSKRESHFDITHRLIARVNSDVYKKSLDSVERWKTDETDYNILRKSCKHFVTDVAKQVGIGAISTDSTDWPETHLAKLIEAAVQAQSKRK